LGEGLIDIAAAGQRCHGIAIGKLLDDGEGALADGTGGTEDGETLQCSFQLSAFSLFRAENEEQGD
jgi:hypothetical protein